MSVFCGSVGQWLDDLTWWVKEWRSGGMGWWVDPYIGWRVAGLNRQTNGWVRLWMGKSIGICGLTAGG